MQGEELKQKNKIIELLGLQNEAEKIEEKDGCFVIRGVENLNSREQELSVLLENYPIRFEQCAFDFLVVENKKLDNPIRFVGCQFKQVSFKKTKFLQYVSFQKSTFVDSVDFSDCRFFEEANFSSALFKNSDENSQDFLKFSRSKFKKQANFSNVYFGKDTYFHRCIFYGDLQIYRSRFDAVANFYFVTFDNGGMPNFSACVFENPKLVNFIGVDLTKFQKKDIENYIRKKSKIEVEQKENREKNRIEEELRVQHARNIKDSFRVVKDVLLAQNNGLEAQVWHKIELYAKEVEIEFLIEQDQQSKKQSYKKFGLIFDKSILYFYRLISNHHNNFSKILNVTFS